jgi:hypothetical protein
LDCDFDWVVFGLKNNINKMVLSGNAVLNIDRYELIKDSVKFGYIPISALSILKALPIKLRNGSKNDNNKYNKLIPKIILAAKLVSNLKK